jgi:threonine dehydrogenase-like Zn-dependent dehydrogenase
VVDADDPADAIGDIVELTGGRAADLVIECTGVPAAIDQGMRMARRGGTYLVIGQYTDAGNTTINPHQIVYRRLDIHGSWAFTGTHLAEYIKLLPRLTERFDLARLVTTYPLADHADALRDVADGRVMKAVLSPNPRLAPDDDRALFSLFQATAGSASATTLGSGWRRLPSSRLAASAPSAATAIAAANAA